MRHTRHTRSKPRSQDRVPTWARVLLGVDGALAEVLSRFAIYEAGLRDELLWGYLPESARAAVTDATYARASTYAAGGKHFERGLWPWETELVERFVPRVGARILLGGAGGGRELEPFARRGYQVTAFEPCEALVAQAERLAAAYPDVRVLCGAYEDVSAAIEHRGPLATLASEAPYDLVWLGWRSLSHVLEHDDRARLFEALARLAPGRPIVTSFLPAPRGKKIPRSRMILRRVLRLGGARPPPAGAEFFRHAGFATAISYADVLRLARASGYQVALVDTEDEGVAVFTPADSS